MSINRSVFVPTGYWEPDRIRLEKVFKRTSHTCAILFVPTKRWHANASERADFRRLVRDFTRTGKVDPQLLDISEKTQNACPEYTAE